MRFDGPARENRAGGARALFSRAARRSIAVFEFRSLPPPRALSLSLAFGWLETLMQFDGERGVSSQRPKATTAPQPSSAFFELHTCSYAGRADVALACSLSNDDRCGSAGPGARRVRSTQAADCDAAGALTASALEIGEGAGGRGEG